MEHRKLEIFMGQDKRHFSHMPLARVYHFTWPHLTAKETGKCSLDECPEEGGISSITTSQSLLQRQSRNTGLGLHFHRAENF